MVKCTNPECGHDDCKGKFCKFCGTPLPPQCPQCGEVLSGKVCPKCGDVSHLASASATIAPPPASAAGAGGGAPGDPDKVSTPAPLSAIRSSKKIAWRRGTLLGKGSFGSVFLGMLDQGKLSAVKLIELGNSESPGTNELDSLNDEIRLMSQYQHENIVQYYGSCWNPESNAIEVFLEYIAGGSLQKLFTQFEGLPETAIRCYTKQILLGLQYLHSHKVVHRDIKGDNILVANDGTVKLADFGCSKSLNTICSKTHGCKTMVGTPYWMAPEVITEDSGYGVKADVWSVGCTVVEMYTGKPPWPEFGSMWAAIYHIANSKERPTKIPTDLPADTNDFLDQCFNRSVEGRFTCQQLLQHPFVLQAANVQSI